MLLNVWNHLLGMCNVSQHLFQLWITLTLHWCRCKGSVLSSVRIVPFVKTFQRISAVASRWRANPNPILRLPWNFVCSVVLNLYCPKYGTLKNLRPCARGVMMHRSRGVAEGVCGTGRGNTGVHPALLFPHGKCCYLYLIEKENLLKWPEMPVVFCGSCIRGRQ